MNRAFIAANIRATPALRAALEELGGMGRAIRPVAAENLHLTLRFLGATGAELLPRITEVLRSATAGVGPIELELVGVGAFPSAGRPSAIWVGAPDHGPGSAAPLAEIVARLGPGLAALGCAPDDRPWVSHLTLARVKARPPAELRAFFERHRATHFGTARLEAVHLMLSELSPAGPRYTVAGMAELGR